MGFGELIVIALLALLVVGPERLPKTIKTISRWIYTLKHQFNSVKQSVEDELGLDEIKRDVHNHQVMKQLQEMDKELNQSNISIDQSTTSESREKSCDN